MKKRVSIDFMGKSFASWSAEGGDAVALLRQAANHLEQEKGVTLTAATLRPAMEGREQSIVLSVCY